MTGTIPAHALYFAGYEFSKPWFEKKTSQGSPIAHFSAGIVADLCGALVWCPMDVIKQRLQVQQSKDSKYLNSYQTFFKIVSTEGIRGLYKGYWAAIATYGPFVGIYFMCYEQMKSFSTRILAKSPEDLPFQAHLGF
jgi:hypothetical protein